MPPAGTPQLSRSESQKITAWLTGQPYNPSGETVRVPLIEAMAWDANTRIGDLFPDHRPAQIDCERGSGWLVEEDVLEIRTAFCNYLSLTQQTLLNLEAGTILELTMSHSDLNFNAPAIAHMAVSVGGITVWDVEIEIPSTGEIFKEIVELPSAVCFR